MEEKELKINYEEAEELLVALRFADTCIQSIERYEGRTTGRVPRIQKLFFKIGEIYKTYEQYKIDESKKSEVGLTINEKEVEKLFKTKGEKRDEHTDSK